MKNYKDLIENAESIIKDATSDYKNSGNTKVIAAAAIGLAAGAVLGILLAPASGTDTRNTIVDSFSGAGNTIKDKARQGMDKLNDLKNQAVDAVKTQVQGTGVANTSPAV